MTYRLDGRLPSAGARRLGQGARHRLTAFRWACVCDRAVEARLGSLPRCRLAWALCGHWGQGHERASRLFEAKVLESRSVRLSSLESPQISPSRELLSDGDEESCHFPWISLVSLGLGGIGGNREPVSLKPWRELPPGISSH